ncbi:hypothetical protein SLEP1_g36490 [Rubroshorea leprosula]|uniref:Uncharacterized protein n=1 Tax=Rubroshorea leprosula TaxID=152421 RepID=A0AAV5KRN3_9ROSI|nr:hypothetical protein SLEP1_g36490 [Rubroshorea leprosula]
MPIHQDPTVNKLADNKKKDDLVEAFGSMSTCAIDDETKASMATMPVHGKPLVTCSVEFFPLLTFNL